jgi:hypothetical protein
LHTEWKKVPPPELKKVVIQEMGLGTGEGVVQGIGHRVQSLRISDFGLRKRREMQRVCRPWSVVSCPLHKKAWRRDTGTRRNGDTEILDLGMRVVELRITYN